MPTKQSYYRHLPDEDIDHKKPVKTLSDYPEDIQNIMSEVTKLKFKTMLKKHSKVMAVLIKILIKGEKQLENKNV